MSSCTMVTDWNSMRTFGIEVLTGEACGLGMRHLFDVNEDGKALLEEFFGGTLHLVEASNWNSTVYGKPAVASIMMPHSYLPELAAFCLLKNGYAIALVGAKYMGLTVTAVGMTLSTGVSLEQAMEDALLERGPNFRLYRIAGTRGTRNEHAMTGRTC